MFLTLALCLGADPQFVVENKCPAFVVTNKVPPKEAPLVYPHGYPVHPTRWTYPGEIHAHLKSGQHANKWPAVWIDTLTKAEAESLHDDDHTGAVRWEYVPAKPPAKASPPPVRAPVSWLDCPPGAMH